MTKNKELRPRRTFTPELKQQIIVFYRGGKRKCDIIRAYDIEMYIFCEGVNISVSLENEFPL